MTGFRLGASVLGVAAVALFAQPTYAQLSNESSPAAESSRQGMKAENYLARGFDKYKKSDFRGAIADLNEAIRLDPKYADAYIGRGLAKSDLGDKQGAIADYNEAIRLKPDQAQAYYNRGLIKKERGDKQEALADFRKASELYQQQDNTAWSNNSRNRIREL
jgi:tetratricopeptide (TPR) repeat protein